MTEQRTNSAEQGGKAGDQGLKSAAVGIAEIGGIGVAELASRNWGRRELGSGNWGRSRFARAAERRLQAGARVEIGEGRPKIDTLQHQVALGEHYRAPRPLALQRTPQQFGRNTISA